MTLDQAKNTLSTARAIRLSAGTASFTDTVGRVDRDDLYRIQVGVRSSLELRTQGSEKVATQVFGLKGAKKAAVKAIGKTNFSELTRRQTRPYLSLLASRKSGGTVNLTLEAGTYYVRIYRSQGKNRYRLQATVSGNGSTPNPSNPNPAPSGPIVTAAFGFPTWVRQFGGGDNDYAFGTAVNAAGDIYVAGVTTPGNALSGSGFVRRYKKDGTFDWQRSLSLPAPGSVAVADIEVDAAGNYYVVGAQIDGTNSDGFVAKYNQAGQQQWVEKIATTLSPFNIGLADAASGIFIDGDDVYVTGIFRAAPTPLNQGKAFVAKYRSDGSKVTAFGNNGIAEFGTQKITAGSGITVANGQVYVTGITDATLTASSSSDAALTGGDAFVASLDRTSGNLLWNQTLAGSGASSDYGRGIAVFGSELYIVGQTSGVLPAGSLPTNAFAGGEADAFLAKYTATASGTLGGTLQWVKQAGGTGLDSAQAITIDSTGRIYLTGETNTGLFGNALGGSDAWIAQADRDGNWVRTAQVGTAQNDEAYALSVAGNTLYAAGQTQATFPGTTSSTQGNYDVWLTQYNP